MQLVIPVRFLPKYNLKTLCLLAGTHTHSDNILINKKIIDFN